MNDMDEKQALAQRRKSLMRMALADTMREYGIPSDWMRCHTLREADGCGARRLHAQFVVARGGEFLLGRAALVEQSFRRHLGRLDARHGLWLQSIGWVLQPGSCAVRAEEDDWQVSQPHQLDAMA